MYEHTFRVKQDNHEYTGAFGAAGTLWNTKPTRFSTSEEEIIEDFLYVQYLVNVKTGTTNVFDNVYVTIES
jgi:hypothetical protein